MLRTKWKHEKCGQVSELKQRAAEKWEANAELPVNHPEKYTHAECSHCQRITLVREFTWEDGTPVGHK